MGGGPAGLYFAILMKRLDPRHRVRVIERNRPDDTFGFGVVFSDATLGTLAAEDAEVFSAIERQFWHWDDIHTFVRGRKLVSTGHGFAGMSRQRLLSILQARARDLGVDLEFGVEVTDLSPYADADLILGADGVNSTVRALRAGAFRPHIDWRPNRFVWLGTTYPFDAFTFYFKENEHGLWRVHAYRYEESASTFIVECTADTFARTGLAVDDEDATVAYVERLFADELAGHRLLKNRSIWRRFPTVTNERWFDGNVVLIGDAVHTAHFSIGSGTKLAMEDAIELRNALRDEADLPAALARYERLRRPAAESLQRAAQVSLEWFENTERYMRLEPEQFHVSLLTRSLRVTHDNLKVRDPALGAALERWFAERAAAQTGMPVPTDPPPPPMFTPFKLRDVTVANRVVVSPMCQYSAVDGTVGDWHLVHLGSRAVGGAGLVLTEMTAVSADARISPGCAGLYAPEHVAAWRRIVDFVHTHSPAKIGIQLGHAGRKGSTKRLWEGANEPLDAGNWPLVSASPIPWGPRSQVPRQMDRDDMDRVRDDFARAARLADEAGFDWLEIHCAHGYLLASFLSPLTNRRTDDYGGPVEQRMRFPLEVVDAVRAAWPARKPMSVRISATDWHPDGISIEDVCEAARLLKAHGCDILDVSAGQTVPDQRPVYGRLFQTPFSDLIRLEVGIPTITVGNIKSYEDCNSVLIAGRADLVAMARAHLWDPYLSRHAARALGVPPTWPPQYVSIESFDPRFE
ncbi:MAG: bifunctional salicylyl-CoA 5-hydroxylase/oxidoreductase [Deltaproteobacteria bacterium]|nr:MAG: bifunctional salicylyl-CoA 5-hydroxylase/oxidoreductase [Deltaproteobacteria bacterium]